MVIVYVAVGIIFGILTSVYSYKQEKNDAGEEKIDTDKNWFVTHLFLLLVFAVLIGYLIKEEGFTEITDYFVLASSAYLMVIIMADTFLQRGRYIRYDKNHIYVLGQSINRNKNYKAKRNLFMFYYNLEGIKINRKQLNAIDEILKEKGYYIAID